MRYFTISAVVEEVFTIGTFGKAVPKTCFTTLIHGRGPPRMIRFCSRMSFSAFASVRNSGLKTMWRPVPSYFLFQFSVVPGGTVDLTTTILSPGVAANSSRAPSTIDKSADPSSYIGVGKQTKYTPEKDSTFSSQCSTSPDMLAASLESVIVPAAAFPALS